MNLWPDIVWWDEEVKQLVMVEITIAFETLFDAAVAWKRLKSEDITAEGKVKWLQNNPYYHQEGIARSSEPSWLQTPPTAAGTVQERERELP